MSDVFKKYLVDRASLSHKEIEVIKSASNKISLRRKQFLLQEGEVCRHYAFVMKGCLRLYRVRQDKTEHITRFAVANWWMSDTESIELQTPSKYYIEALESTDVLLWAKEDMERITEDIPKFKALRERLIARSHHTSLERIYTTISHSSEEKYEKFISTYPDIFNRVPLHMIASYLGLTRKTLSRIRAQHTKQNGNGASDLQIEL